MIFPGAAVVAPDRHVSQHDMDAKHDTVVVAFSVLGLNGPTGLSSEERRRGGIERLGTKEFSMSARRGWLATLNAAGGDRQEIVL